MFLYYDISNTLNHISESEFLLFLFFTLLSSVAYNIFGRLTLLYFSTTHQNVSDCLSSFIFWLIVKIFNPKNSPKIDVFLTSYIPLPGYLIIIFGTLLYNEIIIFYCWGLGYNTKKEISRRARNEASYMIQKDIETEIV